MPPRPGDTEFKIRKAAMRARRDYEAGGSTCTCFITMEDFKWNLGEPGKVVEGYADDEDCRENGRTKEKSVEVELR